MFKRTVGVSCSLKESIDGLEIIVCGKMFHCTIVCGKNDHLYVQSNLSIATIEGSSENRSHKTGGR